MTEEDFLAEQFEEHRLAPAHGGLPDAGLAHRGRRRRAGGVAAAQPLRRRRDREPGRLADDRRRPRQPEHAALARRPAREDAAGRVRVPDPLLCPRRRTSTRSRRRCSPTRSGSRCWSCSRRSRPPSGSRSSCTTCSRCRSTRSRRSSSRSPTATRQLASRARRRVQGEAPQPTDDLPRQREVVDAFFAAARDGDFDALVAVLDPDVVLRADGGALRPGTRASSTAPRRSPRQALPFAQPRAVRAARAGQRRRRRRRRPAGRPFSVMGFTVATAGSSRSTRCRTRRASPSST